MNATENNNANMTGGGDNTAAGTAPENSVPGVIPADMDPLAAAAPPSKKETSLREFLGKMDEYAPIVSIPVLYLN